ncbi:hypothetical protein [Streptomyces microflavus]|uniref:hypothetical protein n=1 Tax=Streptomyces microflavus TaxID=1919 RepID=UPI003B2155DA
MALPDGVPTITVRDTRTHPDGPGHRGHFTLTPDAPTVTLPEHGQIIMGTATALWDEETGEAAVTVLVADAPGMNPQGWTYTLTEHPYDGQARSYPVLLTTALGSTVDLADLAPTEPYDGEYVLVPGPAGPPGADSTVPGPAALRALKVRPVRRDRKALPANRPPATPSASPVPSPRRPTSRW